MGFNSGFKGLTCEGIFECVAVECARNVPIATSVFRVEEYFCTFGSLWAALHSRYSDWLRVGRSGDRILVGARFSAPVQTGPGAHPASCTMGTGSFPGVRSGWGVTLSPHPLLVPWSRKSRAIPLLPLWAVWPVQNLSACTRVNFTLLSAVSSETSARIYQTTRCHIQSPQRKETLSVPSYVPYHKLNTSRRKSVLIVTWVIYRILSTEI